MPMLANGTAFPSMRLSTVEGGTMTLPDDLAGSFGVVLSYRGDWCPLCVEQLAGFAERWPALTDAGVKVVALSVDDAEKGKSLVEKNAIHFPVAHSVDAGTFAAATGAFVNDSPRHLQPTAFVLGPDGTILASMYSSSSIGRLTPAEVLRLVAFIRSRAAA